MRKSHNQRRSATRAAARPSALLLRLVARITGWLQAWLAKWNPLRRARKVVADFSRIHFESLEPRLLMSADLMPLAQTTVVPQPTVAAERSMVADASSHTSATSTGRMMPLAVAVGATGSASVTDADGTVINVTIVGSGALELLSQGPGYALNISGTNSASVVTLTATGGDGKALLTGISADTTLGEADLAAADLTGTATFAAVGTLKLGNIKNASISNGSIGEASISARSVADLRLSAPLAKLSVSVDSWTNSMPGASPSASFLNAAGLRSLAVAGEFAADVRLSGTGITSGFVLDNATIGGALSSGQWFVIGRANSLQAGSTGGAWRAHFTGNLGQLKTTGDLSGFVAAGGLQLLSVGGSLRGATILLGANLGTDAQLGGSGDAADRFTAGTLARLRVVGDIVDTRIAISLDPVNGVLFDGNDASVGSAANRMQELIVGGQLRGSTLIVAPGLPVTVNVGGAVIDPATLPQLSTSPRDAVLPQLSAQLLSDTGSSASDGITSNASLTVRVVDVGVVAALRGRIGSAAFQNLTTTIQPDGSFLVTAANLAALNGGTLPDGIYSIELQAADVAGNLSNTATVAFTLDRSAPSATLALAAASDTGTAGDNITTASTVTIEGSTTAGTTVNLANPAQSTTAAANGSFSFTGLALALGDNDFAFTLTDAAGNTGTATLRVKRESPVIADTTAPTVTAALVADTGGSATDGLTNNPAIAGQASDNVGVVQLLAALDPGSSGTPTFTDLSSLLAASGSFTLNRATLDTLAGGTLADGAHTVRFVARDAAGNESTPRDVSFTLDTAAPSATIALAAASDTGTAGDNITTAATVTIEGSTTAGTTVSLANPAQSTTAAANGSFSFSGLSLALGDNDFAFTLTDAAGNTGTASLRVKREAAGGGDTTAPTLTAALVADTGSSATDGLTNNPAIAGQAGDNVAVVQLLAALDPTATPTFTDVSSLLAANGAFNLDRTALNGLAGGTLADGAHALRLVAVDAAGNRTTLNVSFTLDTTAPAAPVSFGLAAADASNAALDETSAGTVQLRGVAVQGTTVTLAGQNLSAVAGAGGVFVIPGVTLGLGANVLTLNSVDAAGNVGTTPLTRTITRVTAVQTDAVLVWNNIALRAIQLDVTDPPVATRNLALVSLAQYDSLAAIEGTPAYLVQRSVSGPASAQAAAAVAAHRILSLTYPAQKAVFDAALATSLAAIADGAAKDTGIALGLSVADAVLAARANDGSDAFVDYPGSTAIGQWRPTGPMFDVPDEPQWKNVTPFALTSPGEFRPAAPPALDTAAYASAVNEIKLLGVAIGSTRTADQTQQALFWADGKGSTTPPGHWNQIAAQVAAAEGNSLSANARLFAQLNVALADAAIACWDAKYTYGAWRPETAIQNADLDNNPATTADAAWRPLLITPPHPDYVSGHSTFSAAASTVLAAAFGDATAFSTTSATLPGVTRNFTSFSQAADEAGRSRVYGGIHFDFANQAGKVLGAQVGNAVLQRFALTQDTQAPVVVVAATPAATKVNLTLTGQVLDNLSGVASTQYRVDNGALQNLTLAANGSFSITTALPTDGSADAAHTVSIIARDAAGNTSATFTRGFTLDTRAPAVTLSSVAPGGTLSAASRLTGTANATGSALTQLTYQFDNGNARSVVFDATTGAFDTALPFGTLTVGDHTLTVTARDAAGNNATLSRTVKVDALAAFTITTITPANGSGEVGVTQRPQVNFSRPVNAATLTSASFYATGPDGAVLPATIVPSADGSFAWLFFTNPMPGGSQVSLHVDGSRIRAAADGAFLDADADGAAGGVRTVSFTTVSRTAVSGTTLIGRVVDPGPDLEPMTFDDIRRGPDGVIHTPDDVFLLPIAHAKVYILGQEDNFTYTDAAGNFTLTNVPGGNVKVAIDGRTATNAPAGVFFPEMVMDADMRAGVANTLMGSMGTQAERTANADRVEAYLPRIATSVLQNVSDTAPTVITVADAKGAPALSDAERAALTLTINPGSAVGENGQTLQNVQIGIATVPPELVRDMLPPGVLQHTFDITIQAPGVATFTEPVQITFPNVFNAAPGTKLNILSFDHTTGRLVINGTGTVSADGLTVVSDEGSGVKAPGWHGMTPPGTSPDDEPPECPAEPAVPDPTADPAPIEVVLPLLTGNSPAPDALNNYVITAPPAGFIKTVTVTVDSELFLVLKENDGFFGDNDIPLSGGSFTLTSDDDDLRFDWIAEAYDQLEAMGLLDEFAVYGGGVNVRESLQEDEGSHPPDEDCPTPPDPPVVTIHEFLIYRYVNPVHAAQNAFLNLIGLGAVSEDELPVSDAVENGGGQSTQTQHVALYISSAADVTPQVSVGEGFSAIDGGSSVDVVFDPVLAKLYEDSLELRDGIAIDLEGLGRPQQSIQIDRAALISIITDIRDHAPAYPLPAALRTAFADPAAVADAIVAQASAYYTGTVGAAIAVSSGSSASGSHALYANEETAGSGLSGTAASPWGTGIDDLANINELVARASSLSDVVKAYLLTEAVNPTRSGAATTFVLALTTWGSNATLAAFQTAMARTIAHELGHTLGLTHIQGGNPYNETGGASGDVMSYDGWSSAGSSFSTSLAALFLSLDQEATAARVASAMTYYTHARTTGGSGPDDEGHFDDDPGTPIIGKAAIVFDAADNVVSSFDFGAVETSAGLQSRVFRIVNLGTEAVSVGKLTVVGSAAVSTVLPANFSSSLMPGQSRSFTVTFNPALGKASAAVRIDSDAAPMTLSIDGRGTSAGAALVVDASNNNLGGVRIGKQSTDSQAIVLRNDGRSALTITGLALVGANDGFTLNGLPGNLAGNPIVIQPGGSHALSATFTAQRAGLARAMLQVSSNDPATNGMLVSLVATGARPTTVGEWGSDYVSIEFPNLNDNATVRTKTGADAVIDILMPARETYKLTLFDPATGLVAVGRGATGVSGGETDITSQLTFKASTARDSDFDGLPDDIEMALGTNASGKDTDRDGLDDYTEIQQGLDPLGGLGVPVGPVSAVSLLGSAEAVDVIGGNTGAAPTIALVATGSAGLAVLNASSFNAPSVLAQLDLSGTNADVAADATRGLAAVAATDAGLHIVNINNPSAPTLQQTVNFASPVTRVEVQDGIAYVLTGTSIASVDLNTGDIRATLDFASLGGTTLTDIAIDGSTIYTMDSSRTLRSVSINGDLLTARDSLVLAAGGGKLFVGGGVAYVGTTTDFSQGFSTVNVADPADLQLLSGIDAANIAGQSLAANGSGLLVTAGNLRGPRGEQIYAVDVSSSTDPTNTNAFITRINLPAAPKDIVLANGLAFVADGTGGLQIVNYAAFDNKGVAPTAAISVAAVDADPATAGVQVLEGRSLRVTPVVADDVQVRNVELLVNGVVVANDVSFPHEFFADIPTIAQGGSTVTVQVRATDTGGNVGLSNLVTLNVVPDTFAPVATSVSIADGDKRFFVRSIDLVFDEPLDLTLLDASKFVLVRAGTDNTFGTADDVTVPVRLDTRAQGQRLSVLIDGILPPGDYRLTIDPTTLSDRAGNRLTAPIVRTFNIRPASDVKAVSGVPEIPTAPSANPGQQIGFTVPFAPATTRAEFKVVDAAGNVSTRTVTPVRVDAVTQRAFFTVPIDAVTGDLVLYSLVGTTRTDFADGTLPLQILPAITDVQVESVAADGSTAQVLIAGTGFVEAGASEYRFGSEILIDNAAATGADVFGRSDATLGFVPNGYVRVTVPLSDGVFGAISIKTAGGTSASYTTSLASITGVALSGTAADAAQASANAGQAVTVNGAGLSLASDILMRWTDISGNLQMVKLSPSAVSADGTSATLIVPQYANGAFTLQMFGSTSQRLLQIVPTITAVDVQDRTVVFGSGFVEGSATYNFVGASVTDSVAVANDIDVYYDQPSQNQNGGAYLNRAALPTHGLGNVSVTTAGGTSASFALNSIRTTVIATDARLGDLSMDAAGNFWVSDQGNPGHLLKIDPATGQVIQTITMTGDFGTPYIFNYSGLQVLGAGMTLGVSAVPAGSLLVFNGYPSNDRVLAVNPATGAVIASLTLDANYDLSGATYDAASNRIFLAETNGVGSRIVAINAATGVQTGASTAPFNIQTWSGLAVDPTTGHLWLGAANGGGQLVEYLIGAGGSLTELRRVNIAAQGPNQNEISGLSFDATGKLYVASTQGEIYKIDLGIDSVAVPTATLTGLASLALQGTPASAAAASANVGQVIELTGSNFGAGTHVLFTVRDNAGNTRVVSQVPLVINASGTRLQVQVPDAATTADVRVVNEGLVDLGFSGSYADAVYRNVSVSFTAGSATAAIRFADGGLEGLANESWGIDNVTVKRGDATVFADNFESGSANAAWSDASVDASDPSTFSRFSGRFSNGVGQTLSLGGLTAGQTYTLNFDLLVLDSWDGSNTSGGPDLIDVSVDGVSKLRETLANYPGIDSAQTFRASPGIRLQIVPTLTGLINGRPGEDDSFNLIGSGFMEGASSVTIGGVTTTDSATNLTPYDVTGTRNDSITVVAPRTLDGPIRITTAGGYAQLPASFPVQPASVFTGITGQAASGNAGNPANPSANTGQTITLTGQGFTSATLVQFQGIDDSGALGTLTRTGSVGAGGTTLTLTVPALARSGAVSVLGSGASFELQVVPTLKALGGVVAAGNSVVLEGTGLTANDLVIAIDGRTVGSFTVRTIVDGSNGVDQQLLTLTVPTGITVGRITVSTAGGNATLRTGTLSITALADLTPATDVGDTIATALNTGLAINQSVKITSGIAGVLDVDLQRVDLAAGDQLTLGVSNAVGYTMLRIFDATGNPVQTPVQFNPGSANTPLRFSAPATGSYYVGISGYANTSYNPTVPNSGNNASYLGAYTLSLERLAAGTSHLTGSAAGAASGTAANSALASANTAQSISFSGAGLLATDRLVFTTLDDGGNLAEVAVTSTVDLVNQTISAVVPINATTGRVRLERDAVGVLLQIVPTLADVTMNAGGGFVGANLQLSGSGFAEGAMSVSLGGQTLTDISRSAGLDSFSNASRINLTVPAGAATGPVRVTTVGGTSTAFGIGLTSITATGATGTPATAGVATANAGQSITLVGSGLDATTDVVFQYTDAAGNIGDRIVRATAVNAAGTQIQVIVPIDAATGVVRVVGSPDAIALQIVPTITDVQVESLVADGSTATLLIAGTGLTEGGNTEYRFGSRTVLDAGTGTGAQVFGRNDAVLGNVPNGYVRVTVPLSDGVFGAISIKTAGGTSASYTTSLASITGVALSGTAADAAQASANAGQAVTVNGAGLSLASDILMRWTDISGNLQMVKLSPSAVSADGTSATLIVPQYANGAFTLQMFGSTSQRLLQIVPTITAVDVQDRTVVFGSGFVEGSATYNFVGASVTDSVAVANDIDVYYDQPSQNQNGGAYLNRAALPTHGLGNVSVTTAGGTSASFALNSIRTTVIATDARLGDLSMDAAGNFWVSDQGNPGHLLKIDPATGQVIQTITMTGDFGTPYIFNYSGLQVLGAGMTLGVSAVPAGSLLVFNGYPSNDRVLAVNPATGAVIASLTLDANYDLSGATYDAASNRIFLAETNGVGSRIVAINAATGVQTGASTAPFNIQTWSGLAVDPTTGHLWLGAANGGGQLVEYLIGAGGSLTELRRVNIAAQGPNQNEISGLSFDATGKLYVASTQGEIYKITLP